MFFCDWPLSCNIMLSRFSKAFSAQFKCHSLAPSPTGFPLHLGKSKPVKSSLVCQPPSSCRATHSPNYHAGHWFYLLCPDLKLLSTSKHVPSP